MYFMLVTFELLPPNLKDLNNSYEFYIVSFLPSFYYNYFF